ncbi:MAG TPA: GNAT family N-acetyltransferase [Nocardioidaceae bacterium]|nr:GNAT family N-acetyltransferase [Nocardioidaceae bacterium]
MALKKAVRDEVRVTGPVDRGVWRRVLASDPDAVPSQAPEWIDALCSTGRYRDASLQYETANGRLAVLPMVARTGWWAPPGGARDSMPPAWGFGGPLVEDGTDRELLAAVATDLATHPRLRVHLRPNPLHAELWAAAMTGLPHVTTKPARAHVLDLAGGFDVVWRDRFKPTTRTQVRKAERLGVEIETDTTGRLVPVFHQLLRRSVDRWAAQQHEPRALAQWRLARRDPVDKLLAVAHSLGEACRTSIAWYGGRPAAGIIVLRGRNAHFTRAAMDKEISGPTRASSLLQKVAIEEACAAGCGKYHMGESSTGSGVSDFKDRFGAQAYPYQEYIFESLPLSSADQVARTAVKRAIGFRDA